MADREWPYAPLPVIVPVQGGAFADNEQIKPRLHLHIRFFRDLAYTDAIKDFHTTSTRFRQFCRLLNKNTGLPERFPPDGLQAWREYAQNSYGLPEVREFGALGSRVLVLVPNLARARLLPEVPAAWAATFIDHDAEPAGGGAWEFGVVAAGNHPFGGGDIGCGECDVEPEE